MSKNDADWTHDLSTPRAVTLHRPGKEPIVGELVRESQRHCLLSSRCLEHEGSIRFTERVNFDGAMRERAFIVHNIPNESHKISGLPFWAEVANG